MEQVTATISDGGRVLVANVQAWVRVSSQGGLKEWRGSFVLPQGAFVGVGGPYSFVTTDGRSGQILITNVDIGSHQDTQVQFTGTGPFG